MAIDKEAEFPSLDPKTGKIRPKHTPLPADGVSKAALSKLQTQVDLSDALVWAKSTTPPAWWIDAVKAIGKTPMSLEDLSRNTDKATAAWLSKLDSLSRAQVVAIITPVIADSPDVIAAASLAAEAAVDDEFAKKFIVTAKPGVGALYPNDLVYLGDASGTASRVGYDKQGNIADATMDSAYEKGMLRSATIVEGVDGSLDLVTTNGRKFALGFNKKGQFSERTKWAIANLNHYYRGIDRPFVWEGNYVVWDQTDADGRFIAQHLGDNR